MKQIREPRSLWSIFLAVTFLCGVVFIFVALLPYEYQKSLLDKLAPDGNLESFTQSVYNIFRIIAGGLAILFIIFFATLIVFKERARPFLERLPNFFGKVLSQLRNDVREFATWIRPKKIDLLPLVILITIILFGLFFRYSYLWRPMGHDETYTFMAFASRGLRTVITDYHLPNNHVFHTLLVNLAYKIFGDSPAVIRLPAFLAGVLIIPAVYLVARIFTRLNIALISASIAATLPVLIDYSTTARGYTTITFFFLLVLACGAFVRENRNLIGWCLIIIFSSLGLYTNPTMVYPIGVVFTWLVLSMLFNEVNQEYGKTFLAYLIISVITIIAISVLLYSPIIATSGLESIIGNNVVGALSWQDFSQSIPARIRNTWSEWNRNLPGFISTVALLGLGASIFTPIQGRRQRIFLSLAGILWIGLALLVQRVAPWPRIWLFLLPLFVIWITGGLFGLIELILRKVPKGEKILTALIGLFIAGPLILGLVQNYPQFDQKLHAIGAVEQVAVYLREELQPNNVVVATSPDNVVLKYYLRRYGLPDDITELTSGKSFERAIVVVNQAYGQDLEYVLNQRSFLDDVNINSAQEIFKSNRFTIYQLKGH